MSCVGAIFAPDHERVADELVRVCRSGGKIAMINFTPEGLASAFFELFDPYMPTPPPGAVPPVAWGRSAHVRALFGDRVRDLEMTRHRYTERAASAQAYVDLFKETFGPAVALHRGLDPDAAARFDADFLRFATASNLGGPGEEARYEYEILCVVATVV
jgi:2-polyprenyl-6-hydroxyphenyl methylase/3-demethylubiquinone-9 3-methyltransferase